MSRAFVKEDGPEVPSLPDLPVPPGPNWVTAAGLAALRARLAARQAELASLRARAERLDRLPEVAAERDIRYLEARLAAAVPVVPPEHPEEVAFGVEVTVEDEAGRTRTYRLVGEDEVDPAAGRIGVQSPLARALLGLGVGETADWRGGALTVVALGA